MNTTLINGDGEVGTEYLNISKFLGRATEVLYTVEEFVPGVSIALRGDNDSVVAHDRITVEPNSGGGSSVTYSADFEFKSWRILLWPLLFPALRKLGTEAEEGVRESLRALAEDAR